MNYRKAPAEFDCIYKHSCPHMDGISAQWAFTVFTEQWRLNDQVRKLEKDNEQLSADNAEISNRTRSD